MARAAHTFCATKGVGDVAACSTLTVAQELGYVPFTSASPSSGRLPRRRRARRVHADLTDRVAIAQRQRGEARQFADDDYDGDAPELGDARQHDGAEPWCDHAEHGCADHNRYHREDEDASVIG